MKNISTIILAIVAAAILLLPSKQDGTPKPDPTPKPDITVQKDLLDKNTDVYRQLMVDLWTEFADKRSTFEDDEAALKWMNERLAATWTAAYADFVKRVAKGAESKEDATALATALKERKL